MTNAPTMNAIATGTGANRTALIAVAEREAQQAGGHERDDEVDREATRGGIGGETADHAGESMRGTPRRSASIAPDWMTISNTLARSPV